MSAGSTVVTGIVAVVIASMKFAAGPKIHLGPIAIRAYIVTAHPDSGDGLYNADDHQHHRTCDQLRLTPELH